jgi:hypothetical protein
LEFPQTDRVHSEYPQLIKKLLQSDPKKRIPVSQVYTKVLNIGIEHNKQYEEDQVQVLKEISSVDYAKTLINELRIFNFSKSTLFLSAIKIIVVFNF